MKIHDEATITQGDWYDIVEFGSTMTPRDPGAAWWFKARGWRLVREGTNADGKRVQIWRRG